MMPGGGDDDDRRKRPFPHADREDEGGDSPAKRTKMKRVETEG